MDDFEEFKTSVEEVVEIAREVKLQPEDVAESPPPDGKTSADEDCFSRMSKEWFLEMESTRGEDPLKVVRMHLVDKSGGV